MGVTQPQTCRELRYERELAAPLLVEEPAYRRRTLLAPTAQLQPVRSAHRSQPACDDDRGYHRVVTFDEFLEKVRSEPDRTIEQHTMRTGHVLGPPATADELALWTAVWQHHRLPQDLVDLLRRVNGIHLCADLDEGRSYEGLAPLREWKLARTRMWGDDADPTSLSDRYLALSYHRDGAAFIVLNVDSGKYFLMDACGADESCAVGASVADLLDWLWDHRIP